MIKKKKLCFSRAILKNLINDIRKLIKSNEGKLLILENLEEIPYEIRYYILENLTSFHEKEIIDLFHLIRLEYGKQIETVADRALNKMSMAGINGSPPETFTGTFLTAYASRSRHTGRMTLDVIWDAGEKGIHLECFYLTFNPDGVYSFYFLENMSLLNFQQYKDTLKDVIEISFEESCYLVSQSYNFNMRYMSRPALGKFLYHKYLNNIELSIKQQGDLILRICKKLTCRQQINSFFNGLKNRDFIYLSFCLSEKHRSSHRILGDYFNDLLNPGVIFLEGQCKKVFTFNKTAKVTGYSIIIENNRFYKNEYIFEVIKNKTGIWLINSIERKKKELLETDFKLASFDMSLYCRVYEIIDLDELFNVLDNIDNLQIIEEIPYGVHMRVTSYQDDFTFGISFFSGVVADIVINANEFIIFTRELSNMIKMQNVLLNQRVSLVFQGEYKISLSTAFRYMGGQYIKFDDVLRNTENTFVFEDGMCFLCARYLVKDMEQAKKQLANWDTIQDQVSDQHQVFYQIERENGAPVFFAEYILGPNWITISTLGDHDMNIARKKFEDKMYDCLEFNGIEVRKEGIFDILTAKIKKEYPDMEALVKEIYLNKWVNFRLDVLSGMSPSEACQTEEGTRLLWTMFKKLNQKKKKNYYGYKKESISLNEYIQKVESKKYRKTLK